MRVLVRAVGRLAAPDGNEDVAVDAGRPSRCGRAISRSCFLRNARPCAPRLRQVLGVQVLHGRLGELGLAGAVVALAAGDDEIGKLEVGLQAAERASKVARDTPSACASGHSPSRKARNASAAVAALPAGQDQGRRSGERAQRARAGVCLLMRRHYSLSPAARSCRGPYLTALPGNFAAPRLAPRA